MSQVDVPTFTDARSFEDTTGDTLTIESADADLVAVSVFVQGVGTSVLYFTPDQAEDIGMAFLDWVIANNEKTSFVESPDDVPTDQ
jgi:accessory colonization factor AcfC